MENVATKIVVHVMHLCPRCLAESPSPHSPESQNSNSGLPALTSGEVGALEYALSPLDGDRGR